MKNRVRRFFLWLIICCIAGLTFYLSLPHLPIGAAQDNDPVHRLIDHQLVGKEPADVDAVFGRPDSVEKAREERTMVRIYFQGEYVIVACFTPEGKVRNITRFVKDHLFP